MDAGLSSRAARTLDQLLPGFAAAAPPQHNSPNSLIDLSNAQNEVLRPELLEFFKSTVEDRVTSNAFALPQHGGDPQFRQVLASFFDRYFHPIHAVKSEHLVPTAGASDAIEKIIHAVCDDGDSILVPGPAWQGFTPMLKARSNVNIIVAQPPTYDNWDNYLVPSLQAVHDFSAEKSRIKAVLLCNPHNPLARCYSKKAILELMEFCQEHSLHLIVDEIYALTNLNNVPAKAPPFVSALSLTEPLVPEGAVKVDPSRVHVVWSASKLFGMSGFRIRLTTSYNLLAALLHECDIDFITPTHGLFLWAKIAQGARSKKEEQSVFDDLKYAGVRVGRGMIEKGLESDYGWARLRFSMPEAEMRKACGRIETCISKRG
ncbi:PLP-dependent transferase [Setomelanomma holmii]|uniref:PLP-dependent transferase n=1 Tax=Setomelanomma holmii TaxID=210430 RepID=A0A9P4HL99_9PLEO|nr:PLP-dependent transferase [Setomelanomma holmii]